MTVVFGQFVLKRTLGEGALSRGYIAYDVYRDSHVLLKLFLPAVQALLRQSEVYRCYRREFYDATQLRHPYIVPIYDRLQINGLFCYAQPLFWGGTLSSKLESGRISTNTMMRITECVSAALQHAHRHDIVHGHLSPETLLFSRTGEVYVNDFGLQSLVNSTIHRTSVSVSYLSPEQLSGKMTRVDGRADVYALGRILLDIVCRTDGYLTGSEHKKAGLIPPKDIISEDCARIQQLSRRWQNVFRKALAVDVEERYQTVGEFYAAIERAVAAPTLVLRTLVPVRRIGAEKVEEVSPQAKRTIRQHTKKESIIAVSMMLVVLLGLMTINWFPYIGASVADPLRRIFGRNAVTQLETAFFEISDEVMQFSSNTGLLEPRIPWEVPATAITPSFTMSPTKSPALVIPDVETSPSAPTPIAVTPTSLARGSTKLNDLQPLGSLENEGVWQEYLFGENETVAWRTFLQPDTDRPLSIVGIVAFDLEKTDLHFVLGADEPSILNGPRGLGTIPELDKYSGHLIATFNGGFKATHGYYGAMSNDVVAIPPKNDVATIMIDEDGAIEIGVWGQTVSTSSAHSEIKAWRQNAQLVIQNGQVNPLVYNGSVDDWGGTFTYDIVTWRSGIGVNEQRNILYYFAGPALNMPALANAMLASGVHQGMLLDINEYWVHFAAVQNHDTGLNASPLFEDGMNIHTDRYLNISRRDFFYVTLRR